MILYMGRENNYLWIKDEILKSGMGIDSVNEELHIADQVNTILSFQNISHMIFEIEQYTDEAKDIADTIIRISAVNNAGVIILAPGYSTSSLIIQELIKKDIKCFIFGIMLSDQKDQLAKCLNGYYERNNVFAIPEEDTEDLKVRDTVKFKNIGIAGANSRIGTTTQAIQIVKYLILKGYRACYIQMNDHGYVEQIADWFVPDQSREDKEMGKVTYKSVDMFHNLNKLQSILKMEYDFYIYDCGVYSDIDFNKELFLERDFQIFVCGAKPDEITCLYKLIESAFYDDTSYIYTFVPDSDKEAIRELMDIKADKTFFAPYTPDPFVFCADEIYQELIPVEDLTVPAEEEKKKKWAVKLPFGGRKKNRLSGAQSPHDGAKDTEA